MKNSKILLFLAMVIFSIVSCTKENIEEPEIIDPIIENEIIETSNNPLVAQVSSDSDDALDLGCFVIEMPFDLTIDGVVTTIESVENFEEVLNNAGDAVDIDFVYPLDITYEDGETETITSGEALGEAFSVCVPDDGWDDFEGGFPAYVINSENSCYDLVYPLTLTDLDGNQTVIADEAAFIDALANNELLFFTFPLTLIDEDGEEVVAESDEDFFALSFDCEGNHPPCDSLPVGPGTLACYEIAFPISVLVEDAAGNITSVTLEDEDDFSNTILNGNVIGFDFPLTLVDEEGNELVINSEEEFDAAFANCFGSGGDLNFLTIGLLANDTTVDGGECYTIQFPVTFTSEDGIVVIEAVNAQGALEAIFINELNVGPTYPITVVMAEDGSTVTIENEEDLLALITLCE